MSRSLLSALARSCQRDAKSGARVGALILLGLALNLVAPWPLKAMIDRLGGARPSGAAVAILAFFYLVAALGRGGVNSWRHARLSAWMDREAQRLRLRLFERQLRAPMSIANAASPDASRAAACEDVDRVREAAIEFWSSAVAESLTLAGSFAVLFCVDVRFAAISGLAALTSVLVYRNVPRLMARRNASVRTLESKRGTLIGRALRSRARLKAWGREEEELGRLGSVERALTKRNAQKAVGESHFLFSVEAANAAIQATTLGYGAVRVSHGTLSLGALVLFLQYLALCQGPIGRLSAFVATYQKGAASWDRVQAELRLPQERRGGHAPARRSAGIEFCGVSFAFAGSRPLFENLSFTVGPGEVLALVGASGAGKSTLLKLILGFEQPTAGEIRIAGAPQRDLDLQAMRRLLAYADQESDALAATVRENLRHGREPIHEDRLQRVCRRLELDAFSKVGALRLQEGGENLSFGQRQRLTLARALASDRPILLLDEPTSALDRDLERRIVRALPDLLAGRATILVTHRPEPLALATRVLTVPAPGRIWEASL